ANDWLYDVHVYPKSSLASVAKIVTPFAQQGLGSTIGWSITSNAPLAGQGTTINSYVVTDRLDGSVDFTEGSVEVRLGSTALALTTDYTVAAAAGAGATVTVTFTPAGVAQLRANPGAQVAISLNATVVSVNANGL